MAKTYTFPCTLTSYEHFYAVGTHSTTINGGRMAVSEDQSVYAVGHYSRSSGNDYSAVMVTLPTISFAGTVQSVTLRLNVTTNNGNAVYVGRVTDTSNLTNTGGTPWHTGSTTGWIEFNVASFTYASGTSYSLIQDSNASGSLDLVVTAAELVIVTDSSGGGDVRVQTANGLKNGEVYVQTANGLKEGAIYIMTANGLKEGC